MAEFDHDPFQAPIQTDLRLHQYPSFSQDPALALLSPAQCQMMSLLWSIAALIMIAFHLSTDGRFVHSDTIGKLELFMTHFHKRIYLVSLFLGKLVVDSHKCSFALPVQEALVLPQLPSFPVIKVALVSCIYDIITFREFR